MSFHTSSFEFFSSENAGNLNFPDDGLVLSSLLSFSDQHTGWYFQILLMAGNLSVLFFAHCGVGFSYLNSNIVVSSILSKRMDFIFSELLIQK